MKDKVRLVHTTRISRWISKYIEMEKKVLFLPRKNATYIFEYHIFLLKKSYDHMLESLTRCWYLSRIRWLRILRVDCNLCTHMLSKSECTCHLDHPFLFDLLHFRHVVIIDVRSTRHHICMTIRSWSNNSILHANVVSVYLTSAHRIDLQTDRHSMPSFNLIHHYVQLSTFDLGKCPSSSSVRVSISWSSFVAGSILLWHFCRYILSGTQHVFKKSA